VTRLIGVVVVVFVAMFAFLYAVRFQVPGS
jgi:hypothetical protein